MAYVKEFNEIVEELQRQNWRVVESRSGPMHFKAYAPDGKTVVHFAGSGEWCAIKNSISLLKKKGFVWPPKKGREDAKA